MSVTVEVLSGGVTVQELEAQTPAVVEVGVEAAPTVVEVIEQGPRGQDGQDGAPGPAGPPGEFAGTPVETFQAHVDSQNPHPAYDDLASLTLLFENGLI